MKSYLKIKKYLHQVNYEAKKWIEDNYIKISKKSNIHQFWLFYMDKSDIRNRIEYLITTNI